jgi:hypothetical protein
MDRITRDNITDEQIEQFNQAWYRYRMVGDACLSFRAVVEDDFYIKDFVTALEWEKFELAYKTINELWGMVQHKGGWGGYPKPVL